MSIPLSVNGIVATFSFRKIHDVCKEVAKCNNVFVNGFNHAKRTIITNKTYSYLICSALPIFNFFAKKVSVQRSG